MHILSFSIRIFPSPVFVEYLQYAGPKLNWLHGYYSCGTTRFLISHVVNKKINYRAHFSLLTVSNSGVIRRPTPDSGEDRLTFSLPVDIARVSFARLVRQKNKLLD